MKLSARNQMKGSITEVELGVITAKIKIKIDAPVTITAVITKDSAEEMKLKVGDKVEAIIKSTEVIIGK
ncbi:MAG: TOBE domain-containing protein [Candidatus Freyarchaeum deiterrae]